MKVKEQCLPIKIHIPTQLSEFIDKNKFKMLNYDPTLTNLETVQSKIKTLLK